MKDKIEKLECRLCGAKHFLLIQVEVAGDLPFGNRNGVCSKCFKDGELEEKIFLKNKEFVQNQLASAKEGVNTWEEELKKITPKE